MTEFKEKQTTWCLLQLCLLVSMRLVYHFLIKIIAPKNILVTKREETASTTRKKIKDYLNMCYYKNIMLCPVFSLR